MTLRSDPATPDVPWNSSNHFRLLLNVDGKGRKRSNSPVSVLIDFQAQIRSALAPQGSSGTFDEHTIEIVPFQRTAAGPQPQQPSQPQDQASRPVQTHPPRPETSRVPHRIDKLFATTALTLNFVVPTQTLTNFAVYFDTIESKLGDPKRYHGLVGDGDRFCEVFGRRDIAASHFDCFCDFDNDGDLDLFKGGVEPFVYCYENIGRNRLVERGRLTSGGKLLKLPCSRSNRSWVTVAFYDLDNDGQQDFFPSFGDGPDAGRIIFYRNVTRESNGQLTFARIGPLQTDAGVPLPGGLQAGGWFPSICFVKGFAAAGKSDALVGSNNRCWRYHLLGTNGDGSPRFAEPIAVQAGGADIVLTNPRFDCADIDGDGDLDLFAGTQPGPIYWFENIGKPSAPEFATGKIVGFGGEYLIGDAHSGVKLADFDGDGLIDFVGGRFWERADLSQPAKPREFGGFYKNIGSRASPRFEQREGRGPFTEQFQICDAVRQNSVRSVDWDNDGKLDLLAGDTDGFIWFFRNEGDRFFPVFAPGKKLRSGNALLSLQGRGGHARFDVADWNLDGTKDIIAADGEGTVMLFLHSAGAILPGVPLLAGGKPIQIGARASLVICDWNNDGRRDLVLADEKGYYFCKNTGSDAKPVLSPPAPIMFNGKPVKYVRPNLGSFVDWDGDGKRDLIACEFENSIRLYRNIGSNAPGAEPQFADTDGVVLIRGESPQMISGAGAVDWNGDGKLDLLTGQGHAGSGLRFYARDWIENELNNTHAIVTVGPLELMPSVVKR